VLDLPRKRDTEEKNSEEFMNALLAWGQEKLKDWEWE
jgi:hypothetical protein